MIDPPERLEGAIDRLASRLDPSARASDGWREARAGLARYAALALEWNRHLDLSAAATSAAMLEVLAADALILARRGDEALVGEGEALLDVGSGAGGPALSLAILRADLRVALLEPKGKRVAFLRTVIGSLGLGPRVSVHEGRIDPRAPRVPASVEACLGEPTVSSARATFEPRAWCSIGLALAPSALLFLAQEVPPVGAHVHAEARYALPSSGAPRRLLRVARSAS